MTRLPELRAGSLLRVGGWETDPEPLHDQRRGQENRASPAGRTGHSQKTPGRKGSQRFTSELSFSPGQPGYQCWSFTNKPSAKKTPCKSQAARAPASSQTRPQLPPAQTPLELPGSFRGRSAAPAVHLGQQGRAWAGGGWHPPLWEVPELSRPEDARGGRPGEQRRCALLT